MKAGAHGFFSPPPFSPWDIRFPLPESRQAAEDSPKTRRGDLLPLQHPWRQPALLVFLCNVVLWGGKRWDQGEILEVGLGNQGFPVSVSHPYPFHQAGGVLPATTA